VENDVNQVLRLEIYVQLNVGVKKVKLKGELNGI